MAVLAIITLLLLSLLGVKCIFIFSGSNGLLTLFEKAGKEQISPGGKRLEPVTTQGLLPILDRKIKAPIIFFLAVVEDLQHLDITIAGYVHLGVWGTVWYLIMLESLRQGTSQYLLSYITVPGILFFEFSTAVVGPIYLALQLALVTAPTTAHAVRVDPLHLQVLPWSFLLGFILPITLMALPSPQLVSTRFKHTACGWYQQWNVWISAINYILVLASGASRKVEYFYPNDDMKMALEAAYRFALAMSALFWWPAVIASVIGVTCSGRLSAEHATQLRPASLTPPYPSSTLKASTIAEGEKWLISWDNVICAVAVTVWAAQLLAMVANESSGDGSTLSASVIIYRALVHAIFAGPMAIPICLLEQRDSILLS